MDTQKTIEMVKGLAEAFNKSLSMKALSHDAHIKVRIVSEVKPDGSYKTEIHSVVSESDKDVEPWIK